LVSRLAWKVFPPPSDAKQILTSYAIAKILDMPISKIKTYINKVMRSVGEVQTLNSRSACQFSNKLRTHQRLDRLKLLDQYYD